MKTNYRSQLLALICALFVSFAAKSQCTANFTYTVGSNGSVAFTNNSMPNSASVNYLWNFGDSQFSSQINPTHVYGANGVYIVTLQRSDSTMPCNATYSAQITVTNVACNVNPGFTFNFNPNGSVNFVNTSTGTIPQTMYYLQYGDNSSNNFPNNSFYTTTHNYANSGNYTATLTAYNSSVSCYASYTANINVTVQPCPVNSNFTMVKDTSITTSIVWDAYPSYPSNVSGVYWNWGDNSSSTSLYPTHTYSATGFYNICLTVSVSCGSSTTTCLNTNIFRTSSSLQMATVNVVNTMITGLVKNTEASSLIRLFPNPVKDVLTVESDATDFNVSVSDLYGKIIYTGSNSKNINLQNFNSGIYFVKISGVGFSKTSKIIKD